MTPDFTLQMRRLAGLQFAPATLETHWEALQDLTTGELDAAITRAIQECDQFPSPRELRRLVPPPCLAGHDPPCRTHTQCIRKQAAEIEERRAHG